MTNPKIYHIDYYRTKEHEINDGSGFCACCGAVYYNNLKSFIQYGNQLGVTLMSGKHNVQQYCKNPQDTVYHVTTKNGDITFVIADAKKGKE